MPCDDLHYDKETLEEAAIRVAAILGRAVDEVWAVLNRIVLTGK